MPGKSSNETFDEQFAFDSTISPLVATVRGEPILRVPDEQAAAVDAEHHAIVNVFQRQSDWLERHLAWRSDELACEYVRIKLLERVKDKPIPMVKTTLGGLQDLAVRLAEVELRHHEGKTAANRLVQIDIKKITCYTEGDRRRFVAHYNAVDISL